MKDGKSIKNLTTKEKAIAVITVLLIAVLTVTVCYQAVIISNNKKIINGLKGTVSQTADNSDKVVWINPDENENEFVTGINAENTTNEGTTETEEIKENQNNGKTEYVLNTSSKRIHSPDCPSVEETKDKNKRTVEWDENEYQQALDEGYSPCGRCNAGR